MMIKNKTHFIIIVAAALLFIFIFSSIVRSHCEIPCGIYDDPMRIQMIDEHIQTIEKSINQIHELSAKKEINYNQLTRWIINKENHADKLSDIVTQYFMKQRINPVENTQDKAYDKYIKQLTLLHKLMVYSMKCKQTTDLENVKILRDTLAQFKTEYLGTTTPEEHMHKHPH